MKRIAIAIFVSLIAFAAVACSDDTPAEETCASGADCAAPDAEVSPDTSGNDVGVGDLGTADARPEADVDMGGSDRLPADQYCETSAAMFCDYYLRCGRMAVADVAECRAVFAETCESRYEPHYVAYADRGELALSRSGIDACSAHLQTVACGRQLLDLDGACGEMWVGAVAPGGSCGLGIGSFVCGSDATCVIGTDFCGVCRPKAGAGESCGPAPLPHCATNAQCIDDSCVVRGGIGEPCDIKRPCRIGASCTNGFCAAPYVVVALGEACDAARRCPYKSECDAAGICSETGLVGDPCTSPGTCASGWCDAASGQCAPLKDTDATCASSAECTSAICATGRCAPIPAACFD